MLQTTSALQTVLDILCYDPGIVYSTVLYSNVLRNPGLSDATLVVTAV